MATNIKGWITVGGKHIPLMEGESKADAIKKYTSKQNNKTTSSKKAADKKKEVTKNTEGTKKVLYHQTEAKSLEDFDESKRQAGLSDTSTPKGLFLKETDADIGLKGKNQLKMEVTMEKPLQVKDREELKNIVSKHNERYNNIIKNEGKSDDFYSKKNDEIEAKIDTLYAKAYSLKGDAKTKLLGEIDKLYVQQNDILDQWTNSGKNIAKVAQEEMTRTLKTLGYDSLIIEKDKGSFGRTVKSYVVFDIKQLKEIK